MTFSASKLTAAKEIATIQYDLPTTLPADNMRLQLATASLCGTDLHYYKGFGNAGFPLLNAVTLGHEACARVVDANGYNFAVGQLVALNPIIACNECPPCKAGQENHCENKRFPGSATTVPHIDGFFREIFDFPAQCCHEVPAEIKPDHLTFAEPLACAMHAVHLSGVGSGDTLMVTGCGPMGLLTVVAAVATGAQVDVSDIRPAAVALAQKIGAGRAIVPGVDDTEHLNNTYSAVIEASGAPQAFNMALELVKRRSKLVILSNIQQSNTPINLHKIMLKEVSVLGSFQFNKEFKEAIQLITSNTAIIDLLISTRFPISETGEALAYMADGKAAGKILLKRDVDL